MSGVLRWIFNSAWTSIFGGVPEVTSAQEVRMPDQKQSPKSTQETGKTVNGGGSSNKNNGKNQSKHATRKNSNTNKNNSKKQETRPTRKTNNTNSKQKQNVENPIPVEAKIVPFENLDYIDTLDLKMILDISLEVQKKVKNFWGPFVDLEPLKLKSEKLISTLNNKFPERDSTRKCVSDLEEGLKLLEDRAPMLESRGGETSDSEDEEKPASKAYALVSEVGMRVLRLNKQLRIDEPKKKGYIKSLIQQFIRCQTDLDQLTIDKKDKKAIESRRDVHIFCNDTLQELKKKMELNSSS